MNCGILIVEDQEAMRTQLRDFVQAALPGSTVRSVADGAAAIAACAREAPDLILMDIQLPDTDGIDLTKRILAERPVMRIIVVSNHGAATYIQRARAAGAFDYVRKDRIAEDLLPAIRRARAAQGAGSRS